MYRKLSTHPPFFIFIGIQYYCKVNAVTLKNYLKFLFPTLQGCGHYRNPNRANSNQ